MPTNGISGKGGDVLLGTGTPTQVAEIQRWSFNPKSNNPAYRSNRTAGYTARVAGNKDASGSIAGKWDPTNPVTQVLDVGTLLTLNLQTITGQKYVVPGIVDNIKLDVDLDSGDVIGWSCDFSSNGAWTNPVATSFLPPGMGAGAAAAAPEGALAGFRTAGSPWGQPQPAAPWDQQPAAPWGQQPASPGGGPFQAPGWPQAAAGSQQAQPAPQQSGTAQDPLFAAVAAQVPGAPADLVAAVTSAVIAVLQQHGLLQPQQQPAQPGYRQAA